MSIPFILKHMLHYVAWQSFTVIVHHCLKFKCAYEKSPALDFYYICSSQVNITPNMCQSINI